MTQPLELWGGLECTINRVGDRYFSQMERNGHLDRPGDIERFAALGIKAIRYPVLWERTAPNGVDQADWSWPDDRLRTLKELGVEPIVGLVHHGSGPPHTSLVDPGFAEQLAEYAGAVARRYPWVTNYTPVNEPLTTARFSGLYGVWYPHLHNEQGFVRALLTQCKAVVLSMQAIRAVNPHARLIQTDDLGETTSTESLAPIAAFYNERRWLAWDLLCGMVDPQHALWTHLLSAGAGESELRWFCDNRCPPDVIGVNHYITSERWLDERLERYPERYHGGYGGRRFADIETARALQIPPPGIGPLLQQAWARYQLPLAITEVHIDAKREDQMRWLVDVWHAAEQARQAGVDMRAVTVWALLGSFDWNCLVTAEHGYYEPGPYDVRSPQPRATALVALMHDLARGGPGTHPVLDGRGWWHRHDRWYCDPVADPVRTTAGRDGPSWPARRHTGSDAPLLIAGATGTLGKAFGRLCGVRHLNCLVLNRQQMDIADRESVDRALREHRPWAVINTCGYVRVDDAEQDSERCKRENAQGAALLAAACQAQGVQLLTFSSDLVFDGSLGRPALETDAPSPLNVYGASKAEAERRVLAAHPGALVVRTSSFFGPWDAHNLVTQALRALSAGETFTVPSDIVMSPTYVPDLVDASLDLLIDREAGIWHLTQGAALTWEQLVRAAAAKAVVDTSLLRAAPLADLALRARRPLRSDLGSIHGQLLPPLDDALERYVAQCEPGLAAPESGVVGGGRR